jgi:hypothetical protein
MPSDSEQKSQVGSKNPTSAPLTADPDSAGARRAMLGVVFDPLAVRMGDGIAGLTVSRIDARTAVDGATTVGTAHFRGELKLTGRSVRHPDSDVQSVCFEADSLSAARLPRWAGDRRRPWFCFSNTRDAAARLAPAGVERSAEIVVDSLVINRGLSDEVNSARLVRVISGEGSGGSP